MNPHRLIKGLAAVAIMVAATLGVSAPAQAATADKWGFALVDDPTVPFWTTLNTSRQWGSWKPANPASWAIGGKSSLGRFYVAFPHLNNSTKGIPHVTAVDNAGHFCEVVRWFESGTWELVEVGCFKPGGIPDDAAFTVLWTISSGALPAGQGSHAYVQYGTGGIVQHYNSTGAAVTVVPSGTGIYEFRLSGVGLATELAGNLQATAIQPNAGPRRCKIYKVYASGADINGYVICHDQNGIKTNSEFNLSYHRERAVIGSFAPPKYFGYVASPHPPAGPTNFNYPGGGAVNGFGSIGPVGEYIVKYPYLGLKETHAQVTANGLGSEYCNIRAPWLYSGSQADLYVTCFDNSGAPAADEYWATFTSRV